MVAQECTSLVQPNYALKKVNLCNIYVPQSNLNVIGLQIHLFRLGIQSWARQRPWLQGDLLGYFLLIGDGQQIPTQKAVQELYKLWERQTLVIDGMENHMRVEWECFHCGCLEGLWSIDIWAQSWMMRDYLIHQTLLNSPGFHFTEISLRSLRYWNCYKTQNILWIVLAHQQCLWWVLLIDCLKIKMGTGKESMV